MILFIKHIEIEGPETIGEFFKNTGFQIKTIELQKGEVFPEHWDELDAVVSLGGPMNIYEEGKYPFLKEEHLFLKKVIAKEIPFIGVCLGSQLLAKACDARVGRSPEKEIGFFPIEMTEEGKGDPMFKGLPDKIEVFQWHEDMSELPTGARHLASSKGCAHQAFKIGPVAYGLQFHIEITAPTINEWSRAYFNAKDDSLAKQRQDMIEDYKRKERSFCKTADKMYNNFLNIIKEQGKKVNDQACRSTN